MDTPLRSGKAELFQPDSISPFAIFGRFKSRSGHVSDVALRPERLKKAVSELRPGEGLDRLLELSGKLLAEERPSTDRPIAFFALCWKGEFNEDEHPRWPAGSPEGKGGEFRPKLELEAQLEEKVGRSVNEKIAERVARLARRRLFRLSVIAALRAVTGVALNVVPVLGEINDAVTVVELGRMAVEFAELRIEGRAATEFVKAGPHTLDGLRVRAEEESFSSYREFIKCGSIEEFLTKRFGPAGAGYEYHHIVEQGGTNAINIAAEKLQSTQNIVRIPKLVHEAINAEYGMASREEPGLTVRQFLQRQPYEVQYARGLKIMRDLGVIK